MSSLDNTPNPPSGKYVWRPEKDEYEGFGHHAGTRLAVVYDVTERSPAVLLKHGEADRVEAYYHAARKELTDAGLTSPAGGDKASDLIFFVAPEGEEGAALVNWCIRHAGVLPLEIESLWDAMQEIEDRELEEWAREHG